MLDVLFEYPIRSDRSRFSIEPSLARLGLRVVAVVRVVAPDGAVRAFELDGNPGLVRLDPRWHQAALRFVALGFRHILDGTDHLLFLFCLVIPFRRLRPLVLVVTAFTVAHSITLAASAYGFAPGGLWFPPLVETLIAASIVYMALENIVWFAESPVGVARGFSAAMPIRRRWLVAFAFGLVHGFGFYRPTWRPPGAVGTVSGSGPAALHPWSGPDPRPSVVRTSPSARRSVTIAFRLPGRGRVRFVVTERIGAILLSALVGHTAWHWMIDRGDRLHQFGWPAVNLVLALRWLTAAVAVAIVVWLVRRTVAATIPAERGQPPIPVNDGSHRIIAAQEDGRSSCREQSGALP